MAHNNKPLRWYCTFQHPETGEDDKVMSLLPPNVSEVKAQEVALQQAEILGLNVTLKSSRRLYD